MLHVSSVCFSEFLKYRFFFAPSQTDVDDHEYWEHHERRQGWPLQKKAKHNQYERHVLRMSYPCVESVHSEFVMLLRLVEHSPCRGKHQETSDDDDIAEDMQWIKVRVEFPPDQRVPEVSRLVTKKICLRKLVLQPSREQIDGQRKSVHFGKQGDDEG